MYKYGPKEYTTIAITKGNNGKYRCFAWGEGEASISCNFCPHCGRQLEEVSDEENQIWVNDKSIVKKEQISPQELARKIVAGTAKIEFNMLTMEYILTDEYGKQIMVGPDVYKNIIDCLEGRM